MGNEAETVARHAAPAKSRLPLYRLLCNYACVLGCTGRFDWDRRVEAEFVN